MQRTKPPTDEKILPILRSGSKIAPTDVEEAAGRGTLRPEFCRGLGKIYPRVEAVHRT
jgi:hypothetical protein